MTTDDLQYKGNGQVYYSSLNIFILVVFIYLFIFFFPVNKYIKLKRLWLGQKPIPCPKTQ